MSGELPGISVLETDCLMAKKFGLFVAPEEILASGDSLDPALHDGACTRKLVIFIGDILTSPIMTNIAILQH
jgi:hypothetical protein